MVWRRLEVVAEITYSLKGADKHKAIMMLGLTSHSFLMVTGIYRAGNLHTSRPHCTQYKVHAVTYINFLFLLSFKLLFE